MSNTQALGDSAFASRTRDLGTKVDVVRIEARNLFNGHDLQQPMSAAFSHARACFGDNERARGIEPLHNLAQRQHRSRHL